MLEAHGHLLASQDMVPSAHPAMAPLERLAMDLLAHLQTDLLVAPDGVLSVVQAVGRLDVAVAEGIVAQVALDLHKIG